MRSRASRLVSDPRVLVKMYPRDVKKDELEVQGYDSEGCFNGSSLMLYLQSEHFSATARGSEE